MEMTIPATPTPSSVEALTKVAAEALTDSMVERLVVTGSTGLEVLDRLNDPDTRAAVHHLLDGLTAMHTGGSLDTIFQAAAVLNAARSALSDEMVERFCSFVETMVTNLATTEIAELARDTERSLYDAAQCCTTQDQPKSLWGLLPRLFKPETVRTLNLLLAFANCLSDRTQGYTGRPEPTPLD